MFEVKLPETSEDHEESVIVFWHKSEGDTVNEGDVLVEVQTEKATFEIEAEESGILDEILVERGEVASIGDVIAIISTEVNTTSSNKEVEAMEEEKQKPPGKQSADHQFVRASPRVRRLAQELGVELGSVKGTGHNGQPTEEDVRKVASKEKYSDHEAVPFTAIRKAVSRRMYDSLQSTAQLTETTWADVTLLDAERGTMEDRRSWNDLLLFAVTRSLQDHPNINAHVYEEEIHQYATVHLGVAVDTKEGLFVPVVKHADQLNLSQLKEEVSQLIEKAKQNKLSSKELSGATFTVTNLGSFGIQFFTPIINRPEAAILGVGKIETDLTLKEGKISERKKLPLSLTFDHRAIDGAPAAQFLQTVVAYLQDPAKLLEQVLTK